jgi:hypothetical protein
MSVSAQAGNIAGLSDSFSGWDEKARGPSAIGMDK